MDIEYFVQLRLSVISSIKPVITIITYGHTKNLQFLIVGSHLYQTARSLANDKEEGSKDRGSNFKTSKSITLFDFWTRGIVNFA